MADYKIIYYSDELLADNTVSRLYSNNNREWRKKSDDGRIEWHDSNGARGADELFGDGIVKRAFGDRQQIVIYGREQGYGRTLWSNNILTVRRAASGKHAGEALAAVAGVALLYGLVAPPAALSAAEEEVLRQKRLQEQQAAGSNSSGGDSGATAESEWDDGGDWGDADGDFG